MEKTKVQQALSYWFVFAGEATIFLDLDVEP
jgi:hypothetical protein